MNAFSDFINMKKLNHRYVTKYFHLNGLSPTNRRAELNSILGKYGPSFTRIKYCVVEFKRGRTISLNEHRNGQQNEIITPEMVKNIHKIVLRSRQLKVHDLAVMVDISKSATHGILTENLNIRQRCIR